MLVRVLHEAVGTTMSSVPEQTEPPKPHGGSDDDGAASDGAAAAGTAAEGDDDGLDGAVGPVAEAEPEAKTADANDGNGGDAAEPQAEPEPVQANAEAKADDGAKAEANDDAEATAAAATDVAGDAGNSEAGTQAEGQAEGTAAETGEVDAEGTFSAVVELERSDDNADTTASTSQSLDLLCPEGHRLTPSKATVDAEKQYNCDNCSMPIRGDLLLGCRQCNYDTCVQCAAAANNMDVVELRDVVRACVRACSRAGVQIEWNEHTHCFFAGWLVGWLVGWLLSLIHI